MRYGSVQKEDEFKNDRKKSVAAKNVASRGGCIAWWLVTTTYYSDGSTDVSYEYLYTTCDNEDSETGGGGSGGDNPGDTEEPEEPEEPIDLELSSERMFNLAEQNYTDDDTYQQDNDGQIEYDDNGQPLPAYVGPARVDYECRVWITYIATTRELTSAFARDVIARPNSQQYYNPGMGTVVRTVTPVTTFKDADIQGTVALCSWSWLTTFRWTYLSSGLTNTRGIPGSFSAPVSAN